MSVAHQGTSSPAHPRVLRRSRLVFMLGPVALAQALLAIPHAKAALGCRSDPVLVVNGAVVDVVSVLSTTPSAIRELDYTVTVPTGSLLGQTTLTVGLGFPEHVAYVFSPTQRWGTLRIAATVVTQAGVAPFATTVQATTVLAGSVAASGMSTTPVVVTVGGQLML